MAIEISSEAPPASAPTGAMDSLLEKLRAAAPQTRDQRDRRRRARLNERHQKRVASGQLMPELPGVPGAVSEDPVLENGTSNGPLSPPISEVSEPTPQDKDVAGTMSEGEDVADRAASILQGLRGDASAAAAGETDGEGGSVRRDDSLRVRRRRESANDERAQRRRRRAGHASVDLGHLPTSPIPEENALDGTSEDRHQDEGAMSGISMPKRRTADAALLSSPPVTVIVPPSPTASERAVDGGRPPEG